MSTPIDDAAVVATCKQLQLAGLSDAQVIKLMVATRKPGDLRRGTVTAKAAPTLGFEERFASVIEAIWAQRLAA